jgi:hypothetical protein
MKWFAVLLTVAGLCAAAPANRTLTGVIYDNRCSDGVCAAQCPVSRTPKYTLQTDTDGWLLTDQKTPAKYLGKRVTVTGHAASRNKLKVVSISLAAGQAT